jgi:uncharacterized membrane protein YgdD (TMEM256/DUF423 family)
MRKILKKIEMIPDKIVIPIVLAVSIGLWIFTGTATRLVIDAWQGIQMNLLFLTTPLGILLLIAGATTIAVMVIKERRRAKQ